jgi:hypothetical protein
LFNIFTSFGISACFIFKTVLLILSHCRTSDSALSIKHVIGLIHNFDHFGLFFEDSDSQNLTFRGDFLILVFQMAYLRSSNRYFFFVDFNLVLFITKLNQSVGKVLFNILQSFLESQLLGSELLVRGTKL